MSLATAPSGAPGQPGAPSYVLLDKGDPVAVLRADQAGSADTKANPLDSRGFNSVLVDAIPGSNSSATTITVLGGPTPGGPFVQEVDPAALQSGVPTTAVRKFVVTSVSKYVAVSLSNAAGWTIWLTPFNAAAITNVAITGTANNNLAQYGGVAVGVANPVDVRPTGAIAETVADGADTAQGALADAAVVTNAAGSLSAKLRGLVALLAAVIPGTFPTFGWLRVLSNPSTFTLVGTSTANTAQTVTQAAAGAGVRNYLSGLTVSWSGGAPVAGANVQIKDGSTVIWDEYIGQAGATQGNNDFEFTTPLETTANAALSVVVAAAGTGVTTKVSAQGTTGP